MNAEISNIADDIKEPQAQQDSSLIANEIEILNKKSDVSSDTNELLIIVVEQDTLRDLSKSPKVCKRFNLKLRRFFIRYLSLRLF